MLGLNRSRKIVVQNQANPRHYVILLKTVEGKMIYQAFDESGHVVDIFPHYLFTEKQEEYNRLTILFTGAYVISEDQCQLMLKRYGYDYSRV